MALNNLGGALGRSAHPERVRAVGARAVLGVEEIAADGAVFVAAFKVVEFGIKGLVQKVTPAATSGACVRTFHLNLSLPEPDSSSWSRGW